VSRNSKTVLYLTVSSSADFMSLDALLNDSESLAGTTRIPPSPPPSLLARLFGKSDSNHHSADNSSQTSLISAVRSFSNNSYWSMTVVEPISATRCSIRCTLYTTKTNTKQAVNNTLVEGIHARFESTAKRLEKNHSLIMKLEVGGAGMTKTQQHILKQLEEHIKLERKAGAEILPAAQHGSGKSSSSGVAERCKPKFYSSSFIIKHAVNITRSVQRVGQPRRPKFRLL